MKYLKLHIGTVHELEDIILTAQDRYLTITQQLNQTSILLKKESMHLNQVIKVFGCLLTSLNVKSNVKEWRGVLGSILLEKVTLFYPKQCLM